MAIRFILGRAGSGKTSRCLDELRGRLEQCPDDVSLMLLVPEQATFQAEYALVTTPGLAGLIGAQALSFRRLAYRIMQEVGGTARVHIDDSGKKMLIQHILRQHRDDLRLFRASVDQTGFVDGLHRLFAEFRKYRVTAASLAKCADRGEEPVSAVSAAFADKMHDLQLVYARYEERLSELFVDSEHVLTETAERLKQSALLRNAEVWIDGFHGFTPQEYAVIGEMMRYCRQVTIALCVDRDYDAVETPDELDLFHPTARTLIRLKRLAAENGVPVAEIALLEGTPPRFRESPMLAHLERHFGMPVPPAYGGADDEGVSFCAAANRRAEVEGAAREMIRLVRDCGYRWRDMAVMVRDIEPYRDLLSTVLTDYGIPFFFDQKRSVLHHPLIEFVRSALDTVATGWRHEAVFRCVKTDLLLPDDADDGTLALWRDRMCRLENVVLAAGIQGSRWLDPDRWPRLSLTSSADGDRPESGGLPDDLEACRQRIVRPLSTFEEAVRRARSVREMAEAVYRLLEDVRAADKLARWSRESNEAGDPERAREHAQVWGGVVDVLDQVVDMLGEETMPVERFAELLSAGFAGIRLGLVPPSLDQVVIGSMERTRSAGVRHLFVFGVNDGVLPAAMDDSGVLSDEEREQLRQSGIELAEGNRRKLLDESFLIYTALTAPSRHLWISYPLADEEGKSLLPSEVVKKLKAMFPAVPERTLATDPPATPDDEEALAYVAHPGKTLSHIVSQFRRWLRDADIAETWWQAYNWFCSKPDWRDKLARTLRSLFYANRESPLSVEVRARLYGGTLRTSVSRMELFAACPFSHFAAYGLKLAERKTFRLEAPDIGQLFHAALSQFVRRLAEEGVDWASLAREQCFERASAVVDELAPSVGGEILLSSSRYRYIARKLKGIVGRTAAAMGEHARRGAFTPVALEIGFGPGEPLPPLELVLDNGVRMEIVGRIDRVDRAYGERGVLLRVIDYKSSRTALNLHELFYGVSLQMLTYLDVVLTHAERWLGQRPVPAGALYFHVHNPVIVGKNRLSPDEAETAWLKTYKMKGLVLADSETVRLMDRNMEFGGESPLIPVGVKKDGSFTKRSSVVSETQWELLRGYVRTVIRRIGEGITNGDVDIRPYRMGAKTACDFCPYKPVCQFEPNVAELGYKRLERIETEQMWEAMRAATELRQLPSGVNDSDGKGGDR